MRDLAQMIADKTGSTIDFISNPRNEAAENELEVKNDKFGNLGVDFKSLDATLLEEVCVCRREREVTVPCCFDVLCSKCFSVFVVCICRVVFSGCRPLRADDAIEGETWFSAVLEDDQNFKCEQRLCLFHRLYYLKLSHKSVYQDCGRLRVVSV